MVSPSSYSDPLFGFNERLGKCILHKKRCTAEGTKKQQLRWEQETWREEVGVNVQG